ncbi:MAG: SAM-dependent methyltransferase [Alphaproteobacteria bacterium]|nr:SAM-dependent methyltransferase [Alphaproteobacteria bacterium]
MSQLAQTDFPPHGLALGPRLLNAVLNRISDTLSHGQLAVTLPNGQRFEAAGSEEGPTANLRFKRYRAARQVLLEGSLGLADSYISGDWETDDLTSVIELGAANIDAFDRRFTPLGAARVLARLHKRVRANTRRGSRRNIAAHYDLGNEFYAAWLDPSMTYSSARFSHNDKSLATSQVRKFDQMAEILDLQPGDHLLEIGCGWGAFAIHAATQYRCRVTAITVSPAQAEWARTRVLEAGLEDRVKIRLQDYRDVSGQFDKIGSIEMFEAVGEAYWPEFFGAIRDRLRPGGLAGLQVITIAEARFDTYRRNPDFIQLRVFPGGMLPSPVRFASEIDGAGLGISNSVAFGPDYGETLRRWRIAFETAWPTINAQGFDERFRRLWRYYLCYCEAGFRAGIIDVGQYQVTHQN